MSFYPSRGRPATSQVLGSCSLPAGAADGLSLRRTGLRGNGSGTETAAVCMERLRRGSRTTMLPSWVLCERWLNCWAKEFRKKSTRFFGLFSGIKGQEVRMVS